MIKSYDQVNTRGDVESKKGTSGRPIQLVSNYFRFKATPNFVFYKYRWVVLFYLSFCFSFVSFEH